MTLAQKQKVPTSDGFNVVAPQPWHTRSIDEVHAALDVGWEGLSEAEAARRLETYGPNELVEKKGNSALAILFAQFTNVMVVVLIVAAIVSGITGDLKDTAVIGVILVLNAVLGFVQEFRAEKAMAALRALATPLVRVTRGGNVHELSARELVPGDILHLETGCQVGADARLIEAANLRVEEAALTGESVPVEKQIDSINDENAPLGDRRSMVFAGTAVTYGRGLAIVTATGMKTELGRIADMLQSGEEKQTPLQARLAHLGKWLAGLALGVCVLVFLVGLIRGEEIKELFLTAISLAVAAIPESLPAIITVALALGAQRMVRQNALIRKLPAVETLGCVTTICSDKTGTLTQNKMTVVDSFGDAKQLPVSMALCSDAQITAEKCKGTDDCEILGEPTESALVRFAFKQGIIKHQVEKELPRVAEAPFDSVRKMMSTIHRKPEGGYIQYTKGAPDELLARCAFMLNEGAVVPLTNDLRVKVLEENRRMAGNALRVLGSAYKEMSEVPGDTSPENIEKDLVFIGLAGMIDPVRPEVKAAIGKCRLAGIKPIMITGDHRDTAVAIAKELGVLFFESQAKKRQCLKNKSPPTTRTPIRG
jgi:Ca2+-transporting ATPase